MFKRILFAGTASLALAVVVAAAPARAQIQIAAAGPMTGEYASFGQQLKEGAELAVADINAHGGVLGQQLVLNIGDDACDPKQAVSVANGFAAKKVVFVAGHF
jgi:branched-chain amino acid transport system substrate-binding protein